MTHTDMAESIENAFMREDAVGKRQLLDQTGHSIEHSFPPLERCEISSNRHPALAFCLSMIFSGQPDSTFRIML